MSYWTNCVSRDTRGYVSLCVLVVLSSTVCTSLNTQSVTKSFLLVAADGAILRMDAKNYTTTPIPNRLESPVAVTYDPVEERLYWTDVIYAISSYVIQTAKLDGRDMQTIFRPPGGGSLVHLALDPLSRLMFYTDSRNRIIAFVTLSKHVHRTVINSGLRKPNAIVLDNSNGVMYWADWGTPAKIERANYDGSNRRVLVDTGLVYVFGLVLDRANRRLYWVDSRTNRIETADLQGNGRRTVFLLERPLYCIEMELFENALYLSDWSRKIRYVFRKPLNESGGLTSVFNSTRTLRDIFAYRPGPLGSNGCGNNNGGCSVICIPLPGNNRKCMCPDHHRLSTDRRTCVTDSKAVKPSFLLIAETEAILKMNADNHTATPVPIAGQLLNPAAVDYDPIRQAIYWAQFVPDGFTVKAAVPREGYTRSVTGSSMSGARITDLAVDPWSDLVIYTDAGNKAIVMIDTPSRAHKTLINSSLDNPEAIVLDTVNGVMYWADWGTPVKIERANYDGSDRRVLVDTGLVYVTGLALDVANDRLYWADAGSKRIESSDLRGTGRRTVLRAEESRNFLGLALFDNALYVTDSGAFRETSAKHYVLRKPLNESGGLATVFTSTKLILDIHAYNGGLPGSNGCGNDKGGCSGFCIPMPGNSRKCMCPDCQRLSSDGQTCEGASCNY